MSVLFDKVNSAANVFFDPRLVRFDLGKEIQKVKKENSSEIAVNGRISEVELKKILQLSQLTKLDLSNGLASKSNYDVQDILRKGLPNLRNLRFLILHNCGLSELPENLKELPSLELLDLSKNDFKSFPEVIAGLKALKYLCINSGALTNVPEKVSQLENLELLAINDVDKLILKDDRVFFPKNIGFYKRIAMDGLYKFSQIKRLDLSSPKNAIHIVVALDFSRFKNLEELSLFDWKLRSIPTSIFKLDNLRILDLGRNQIEQIPLEEFTQLKNLKCLFLPENHIQYIPPEMKNLNLLEGRIDVPYGNDATTLGLFLKNNPIKNVPIEIVDQGFGAIKNYFESIERGDTATFNSAKLMIVGRGRVGKTSLLKKLINPEFSVSDKDEETTRGIDIRQWSFDDKHGKIFDTRIWDFGGQRNYLTPHQFFLTKRSLYLLVWDALQEEDDLTFGYWLNLIKVLSTESPVILVMNKADERTKSIDEAGLKKTFPNIVNFHKVSCLDGTGIDVLRNEIIKGLTNLPHVTHPLSFTWKYVRDNLESSSESTDFITEKDYYEICSNRGLNEKDAGYLSNYLHDLGTIIHFNSDQHLLDTVILNPEWLTKAVYAIVDDNTITENKGIFDAGDLKRVWGKLDYSEDKFRVLIRLMEKFELCFYLTETGKYVIPLLLSPTDPEIKWGNEESLHFEYAYAFMPTGIMTKFIVRNHEKIGTKSKIWKHGAFFVADDIEALVKEDRNKKKITLQVRGRGDKKGLLSWLRHEIEAINNVYPKLEVEKRIPCNCTVCSNSDVPHLYDYTSLLERKGKGKLTIECVSSYENVNVIDLLEGFDLRENEVRRSVTTDRSSDLPQEKKPSPPTQEKILFLSANPSDTKRRRIDEEVKRIDEGLRRAQKRDLFQLVDKWAVQIKDVSRALLDEEPTIVHFSGYGSEKGEILLEDMLGESQEVNIKALGKLFELFKQSVKCVLLNACYTEAQAEEISKHINYVVGMRSGMPEKAAINFSEAFYDAIGAGRDVEFAFKFANNSIELENLKAEHIPVLKKKK